MGRMTNAEAEILGLWTIDDPNSEAREMAREAEEEREIAKMTWGIE